MKVGKGPRLGVILLDFQGYAGTEKSCSPFDMRGLGRQPVGFLEHPQSWGCDTIFRVAQGCTPEASAAATKEASRGLNEAAQALEGRVDLITTDCAYTIYAKGAFDEIATPVLASSLTFLDFTRRMADRVAIVASSSEALLGLTGDLSPQVHVIGLESKPEWARYQAFTLDMPPLNQKAMGRQMLESLSEDFNRRGPPDVLLLECTGLPQFRAAIRQVFSGPLIDVSSLVHCLLHIRQPARALVKVDWGIAQRVSEPPVRR